VAVQAPSARSTSSIGGRFVRRTVGIDGNRVPGRAGGDKFLFSNPLYGCSLHAAPEEKNSRMGNVKRATQDVAGVRIVFLV